MGHQSQRRLKIKTACGVTTSICSQNGQSRNFVIQEALDRNSLRSWRRCAYTSFQRADINCRRCPYQRGKDILAEIIDEVSEERKSVTWELPYFEKTTKRYVDFKKTFSVRLCGLDLCVFTVDGSSTITADQPPPGNLIPTWVARYSLLQQELKTILKNIKANWKSGNPQRMNAVRLFTAIDHGGVFAPTVKPSTGTLRYDLKRLTRLLAPRSNALLTSYGNFLARSAFEHDLERPKQPPQRTN